MLLILISPLLLLITILLAIYQGGFRHVIFRQERMGYRNRTFKVYKFKTMRDDRDESGNLLPDKERTTALGNMLRKLSFDEFPQLLNILKGEMSIIGPRPVMLYYLENCDEEKMHRHDVRPGITGWAQVNGRNSISMDRKIELDLWYIEHISFRLDILIAWKTAKMVLSRRKNPVEYYEGDTRVHSPVNKESPDQSA